MQIPITVDLPDTFKGDKGDPGPAGPAVDLSGLQAQIDSQQSAIASLQAIVTWQASQIQELFARPVLALETGTWTPALTGSISTTGQTYKYQEGWYCKIGRFVAIWGYLQFGEPRGAPVLQDGEGTIQGRYQLTGAPFPTARVSGMFSGGVAQYSNLSPSAANITGMMIQAEAGTTIWDIYAQQVDKTNVMNTLNSRWLVQGDFNGHTQFSCHACYFTD